MRHVIVHYHIFKNAGSSLDAILRNSLGAAWVAWDPGNPSDVVTPNQLASFIVKTPQAVAVSSHQARPPIPLVENLAIHPLFFLRHPILRAASVYKYEKAAFQKTQSAAVATNSTFSDYIRWHLNANNRVLRNFQTIYLSGARFRLNPGQSIDASNEIGAALDFLKTVPVFGIVERFTESIRRFQVMLQSNFPQIRWFEARENSTSSDLASFADIRRELGESLFRRLEEENRYDLELYEAALEIFESSAIQSIPLP